MTGDDPDWPPVVAHLPARTRILAAAGIVGPCLFALLVLAQQVARRGTYDPAAQLVSDLTAGPYGWVQQVNFILFGFLMIAFAAGLRRGVRPVPPRVSTAIVGLNGLELVVAGLFPLQRGGDGRVEDPLGVHTTNGVLFFASIGVVLAVLASALSRDPNWRALAPYTGITGITLIALFAGVVTLVRPETAPLHEWLGTVQRLVLAVWMVCVVILALRLRRLARRRRSPWPP